MSCLEVRFEQEGFVSSCIHHIWGCIVVVPILFPMFCIFLFKICYCSLLHVSFSDGPECFFIFLSWQSLPARDTYFICFVDAKHSSLFLCLGTYVYCFFFGTEVHVVHFNLCTHLTIHMCLPCVSHPSLQPATEYYYPVHLF